MPSSNNSAVEDLLDVDTRKLPNYVSVLLGIHIFATAVSKINGPFPFLLCVYTLGSLPRP